MEHLLQKKMTDTILDPLKYKKYLEWVHPLYEGNGDEKLWATPGPGKVK